MLVTINAESFHITCVCLETLIRKYETTIYVFFFMGVIIGFSLCYSLGVFVNKCRGEYLDLIQNKLYSSPNIIRQIKSRRMRWTGLVARMGEERKVYRVLMGKPEVKSPLERPRRRWEDGIRMDLREIVWGSVDWIQLAQDRDRWRALVNTVMNLRVLAPRS
jgi:hypothetical protein